MLKKIAVASALAMTVASASFAGNPAPSQQEPEPAPMAEVEVPVVTGSLGSASGASWIIPVVLCAALCFGNSSSTSGT